MTWCSEEHSVEGFEEESSIATSRGVQGILGRDDNQDRSEVLGTLRAVFIYMTVHV